MEFKIILQKSSLLTRLKQLAATMYFSALRLSFFGLKHREIYTLQIQYLSTVKNQANLRKRTRF